MYLLLNLEKGFNMNKLQKQILAGFVVVLVFITVYVPWQNAYDMYTGFGFLWDDHTTNSRYGSSQRVYQKVYISLMIVEYAIACIIAGILFLIAKSTK